MKTLRFKWAVLVVLSLCCVGCVTLQGIRQTLDPETQRRHREIAERLAAVGKEIKVVAGKVSAGEIPIEQGMALVKSLNAETKALIAEQAALPKGSKALFWISIIGNIILTVVGGERALAVKKGIGAIGKLLKAVEGHSSKGGPARDVKETIKGAHNELINDLASKLFPAPSGDPVVVSTKSGVAPGS